MSWESVTSMTAVIRVEQVRQEILGPAAEPLLVIGPRPLRRSLACYANTEPLLFTYLDNAHTVV